MKPREAFEYRRMMQLVHILGGEDYLTTEQLLEICPHSKSALTRELRLARREGLIMGRGNRHMITVLGRERMVLSWIGRQGLGSEDQMVRRFDSRRRFVSKVLNDLFESGMLIRAGMLRREPEVYVATRAGLDIVGLTNLNTSPLAPRKEGHLRTCVDYAIYLELEYGPRYIVMSEREVSAYNRRKEEHERLASPYYIRQGEVQHKCPDLVRVRERNDGTFSEVYSYELELTVKNEEEGVALIESVRTRSGVTLLTYITNPRITKFVKRHAAIVERDISARIARGELDPAGVSPMEIHELRAADVPGLRRLEYYKPVPIPGAVERYERMANTREWRRHKRYEVLSVVRWIAVHGAVAVDSVATEFGLDGYENKHIRNRAAWELLLLGHGAGWLYHSKMLHAEDEMFFATKEGLEAVGLSTRYLLVNYRQTPHYEVVSDTCTYSRIAAELRREFPQAEITSRFKLRADGHFSGIGLLDVTPQAVREERASYVGPKVAVSKAAAGLEMPDRDDDENDDVDPEQDQDPGASGCDRADSITKLEPVTESVGENKSPGLLIANPNSMRRVALVYQRGRGIAPYYRISIVLRAWLTSGIVDHVYLYIGEEVIDQIAKRVVEDLHLEEFVTLRELPVSEREKEMWAARSAD